MKRATDKQIADDIVRAMRLDPWRSFTVYELTKDHGRTAARLRRILESDTRFERDYHDDRQNVPRWMLHSRLFAT